MLRSMSKEGIDRKETEKTLKVDGHVERSPLWSWFMVILIHQNFSKDLLQIAPVQYIKSGLKWFGNGKLQTLVWKSSFSRRMSRASIDKFCHTGRSLLAISLTEALGRVLSPTAWADTILLVVTGHAGWYSHRLFFFRSVGFFGTMIPLNPA